MPPHTGLPPSSAAALPSAGRAPFGQASATAMSMKWSALHDAAALVAGIAGIAGEPSRAEVRNFPAVMRDAGGWRRKLAEEGIDDLAVIMEAGLSALLSAHARGVDASAAALALWQEFHGARGGLLALSPLPGTLGPKRSA